LSVSLRTVSIPFVVIESLKSKNSIEPIMKDVFVTKEEGFE